jgi:hypothetical protein
MELLPKDFVPELNTKNLAISPRFRTITHMTTSAKRFRSYGILSINAIAEFCTWTEQRKNGSSISSLGGRNSRTSKYRFGIQLSQLSDGPLNSSKWLAICELRLSKTRSDAESAFLADHTLLYKSVFW